MTSLARFYNHFSVGPDDFLGQIYIPLSKYTDGKEHLETFKLKSEDLYDEKEYENGEIECKIYWTERKFDDDLIYLDQELQCIIRIQCFMRRVLARKKYHKLRLDYENFLRLVYKSAIKITSICRIRLARKELKRLIRFKRAVVKVQKRIRIYLAKKIYKQLQFECKNAICIQKYARVYICKTLLRTLKEEYRKQKHRSATVIQKYIRRYLTLKEVQELYQIPTGEGKDEGKPIDIPFYIVS